MKHNLRNSIWLATKQILRDHTYTVAQFLLALVFAISLYIKLFYFILPDVSSEIKMKLSADVLSTTLTILMVFSVIIYILVTLIYNRDRSKTFGVMRGVGARKSFILLLLFFENLIILFASSIIGLIFSAFFFNPSAKYLERMYSISIVKTWYNFFTSIGVTLAMIIIISVITTVFTSVKILFSDPYDILRSRE